MIKFNENLHIGGWLLIGLRGKDRLVCLSYDLLDTALNKQSFKNNLKAFSSLYLLYPSNQNTKRYFENAGSCFCFIKINKRLFSSEEKNKQESKDFVYLWLRDINGNRSKIWKDNAIPSIYFFGYVYPSKLYKLKSSTDEDGLWVDTKPLVIGLDNLVNNVKSTALIAYVKPQLSLIISNKDESNNLNTSKFDRDFFYNRNLSLISNFKDGKLSLITWKPFYQESSLKIASILSQKWFKNLFYEFLSFKGILPWIKQYLVSLYNKIFTRKFWINLALIIFDRIVRKIRRMILWSFLGSVFALIEPYLTFFLFTIWIALI